MTTPDPGQDDRTIAHLLSTAEHNTGHLSVHLAAAQAALGDPDLLAHHLQHALGHVRGLSSHLARLRDPLARRVPAVARQLAGLDAATPGSRAAEEVPRAALDMSIAHDLASGQAAASHVDRHITAAQDGGNPEFDLQHGVKHVAEITHNVSELDADLSRRLPGVRAELARLHEVTLGGPVAAYDDDGRSMALVMAEARCDGCGAVVVPGCPCLECERPAAGAQRAFEETRARFASQSVNGEL